MICHDRGATLSRINDLKAGFERKRYSGFTSVPIMEHLWRNHAYTTINILF